MSKNNSSSAFIQTQPPNSSTGEHSSYFYGINGFEHVAQIETLGSFFTNTVKDPLLRIIVGVRMNRDGLSSNTNVENVRRLFAACKGYPAFIPMLRYSFRYSLKSVGELQQIKQIMPFVKYIQLDDLPGEVHSALQYAVNNFRVDCPVDDRACELLHDKDFVDMLLKQNNFILLDNSKGTGKSERLDHLKKRIQQCLDVGVNRIAVAGGFGPNSLSNYFYLKDYFKIHLSIDAESKLMSKGRLDLDKAKMYLSQLMAGA